MDELDRKLLNILQKRGRCSLKNIAEQCYISSPAASARIHQLEEKGYIKSYGANLDYRMLGYPIKAYISLALEPVDKEAFYPFVDSIPNVLECDCVTGPYSMLLKVVYPDTDELDSFIGQLQQFGRTNTQIVFSTNVGPRGIVLPEEENVEASHNQ